MVDVPACRQAGLSRSRFFLSARWWIVEKSRILENLKSAKLVRFSGLEHWIVVLLVKGEILISWWM